MSQMDNGRLLWAVFRNCEKGNFLSKDSTKRLINKICEKIKMTPLAGPFTGTIKDNEQPELNGCSGVLIIKESHIAVHLWVETKEASIVINSCVDFDVKPLIEFLKEEFFTEDMEIKANVV